MYQYRITKYDPTLRNNRGTYTTSDWISISDIGKEFNGQILTSKLYQKVEDAYVLAALSFLKETGGTSLMVHALENYGNFPISFANGDTLKESALEQAFRNVLRERYWCRFEDASRFVHFGYDYYWI